MSRLQDIEADYRSAEITCLFIHNRHTHEKINLLTVIELIPSEQQVSKIIGTSVMPQEREALDDSWTLYLTRFINYDSSKAIEIYSNAETGMILNSKITIQFPYLISQEPPEFNSLLITGIGKEDGTISQILPRRNTSFRVWSKLNTDKTWLNSFAPNFYEQVTRITVKYLGFNLAEMPEHIGNIYVCACNPFLRKWDSKLIDHNRKLSVNFHERSGKSVKGCKLVLEDERCGNIGFSLVYEINKKEEIIDLPYFPNTLRKKLYDQKGNLLESLLGQWMNFEVNMTMHAQTIQLQTPDGIESVNKISNADTIKVGKYDHSLGSYLRNEFKKRHSKVLESNREFVFFPPVNESRDKAKKIINELLNRAKNRCIILDPYFGETDLIFAFKVENISIPIQIISSAMFLNGNALPPKTFARRNKSRIRYQLSFQLPKRITYGNRLMIGIENYRKYYPVQSIECKVIGGSKKSLLHDRYIVIDNDVYLLGSSLNEFGSRATTLIKVPAPEVMIAQAVEWWGISPSLSDYLLKDK